MYKIILLLIFIVWIVLSFIAMKKLDSFLRENVRSESDLKNGENVIKIACDNPIMMSSVSEKLDTFSKEHKDISFSFYTGSQTRLRRMLENESVDIILLMERLDAGITEEYGEKISSFLPHSLSEPMTGFVIEPLDDQQMNMYVVWKKEHITEKQRVLISYL